MPRVGWSLRDLASSAPYTQAGAWARPSFDVCDLPLLHLCMIHILLLKSCSRPSEREISAARLARIRWSALLGPRRFRAALFLDFSN